MTAIMGNDLKAEISKKLAKESVRLYQLLSRKLREYDLGRQLLRSGTSVGANIAEARFAVSNADFCNKLSIARKEASETLFWLELLEETSLLPCSEKEEAKALTNSIINILTSIINKSNGFLR
jgi:four helix bundle protein